MPSGTKRSISSEISRPQSSACGLLLVEDAREAAFAAADVEHAFAGEIAEVLADQLDVIDPRIDGGGEMLFVARGFVERRLDAGAQLGGELRGRRGFAEQTSRRQSITYARVRKIGRPSLLVVGRAVALGVVHGFDVDVARPELGIGDRRPSRSSRC